jgi:predicted DNA repair protein MutK
VPRRSSRNSVGSPTHEKDTPASEQTTDGKAAEKKVVRSAITTDFVLSCEIMVIALNEVAGESLTSRAIILAIVGLGITVGVYGVVALIVKMDDIGLHMAKKDAPGQQKFGRFLVEAMPKLLALLSVVGHLRHAVGRRPHHPRRHR